MKRIAPALLAFAVGFVLGRNWSRDHKPAPAPTANVLVNRPTATGRETHLLRTVPQPAGELGPDEWWFEIAGTVTVATKR